MKSSLDKNSYLLDTYAYEVDDYNTICRSSANQKARFLVRDGSGARTEMHFDQIFADDKTLAVFTRLLEHARQSSEALSFPYRCDTQTVCYFYRLTISVSTARHILFFNKLLGHDPRPEGVFWRRVNKDSVDALPVCSNCNRIDYDGQWRYFQEMVELEMWPSDGKEMACSSTICDDCERGIEQRISQSLRTPDFSAGPWRAGSVV